MSELHQSGQHPDADQLSAYAEHALPPHEEQRMLAHLANCTICRNLVYFAQPSVERQSGASNLAQQLHRVASRLMGRPWSVGWAMTCSGAVALACAGVVIVHFWYVDAGRTRVASSMIAVQAPLPATTPQVERDAVVPPSTARKQTATTPQVPKSDDAEERRALKYNAQSLAAIGLGPRPESQSPEMAVGGIPGGGNAGAVTSPPGVPKGSKTVVAPGSPAAANQGVGNNNVLAQQALLVPPPQVARLGQDASGLRGVHGQPAFVAGARMQPQAPPQTAPVATSPAPTAVILGAPPLAQGDEANIRNASPVTLSARGLSKATITAKTRPILPSLLPAVSTVSNGRQTLAVDSVGDLYLSRDAGISWRLITPHWTGRALALRLAAAPATALISDSINGRSNHAVAAVSADQSESSASPANGSAPSRAFEMTTDTGVVWTSAEGETWRRRLEP